MKLKKNKMENIINGNLDPSSSVEPDNESDNGSDDETDDETDD